METVGGSWASLRGTQEKLFTVEILQGCIIIGGWTDSLTVTHLGSRLASYSDKLRASLGTHLLGDKELDTELAAIGIAEYFGMHTSFWPS